MKVRNKKHLEKLLQPLHAMIGCQSVKTQMEDLVYLAYVNAIRKRKRIKTILPSLHTAFLGSPGTGKTTVARLYGHILHKLGYLSHGQLIEASRADLVAGYIGQTALRIREFTEKAHGGVLFIDEAYSLAPNPPVDDFGPEAISELIQVMENNREDLVVIFAGYTDEMKHFIESNRGLRSRIPNVIEFPDYTPKELLKIFQKFCHDSQYHPSKGLLTKLNAYLHTLDAEAITRMGNARGIRNIFEETIVLQSRRIMKNKYLGKKILTQLEESDLYIPTENDGE